MPSELFLQRCFKSKQFALRPPARKKKYRSLYPVTLAKRGEKKEKSPLRFYAKYTYDAFSHFLNALLLSVSNTGVL